MICTPIENHIIGFRVAAITSLLSGNSSISQRNLIEIHTEYNSHLHLVVKKSVSDLSTLLALELTWCHAPINYCADNNSSTMPCIFNWNWSEQEFSRTFGEWIITGLAELEQNTLLYHRTRHSTEVAPHAVSCSLNWSQFRLILASAIGRCKHHFINHEMNFLSLISPWLDNVCQMKTKILEYRNPNFFRN